MTTEQFRLLNEYSAAAASTWTERERQLWKEALEEVRERINDALEDLAPEALVVKINEVVAKTGFEPEFDTYGPDDDGCLLVGATVRITAAIQIETDEPADEAEPIVATEPERA